MAVLVQSRLSAPPKIESLSTDFIWRFSVKQYHEMIQSGILTENDPVELIEGLLVTKMPKNPAHRMATQLTREALRKMVPTDWYVDSQEPITLSTSEPEPDVIVIRGNTRDYFDRHPGPEDIAILIEVSDATLTYDQTTKKHAYAAAGIPTYWIVNLPQNRIEVYPQPSGPVEPPDYRNQQNYDLSEKIPVIISGQEVGRLVVSTLLPNRSEKI